MTLDPTLFAAAVVTVVAAVSGAVVQIINANSAARDRREAAEERKALIVKADNAVESSKANGRKADAIIEKTTGIEHLTNSTNANLQKALDVMTERYRGMEKLIAQMEQEKKSTAAMRAQTDQQAVMARGRRSTDLAGERPAAAPGDPASAVPAAPRGTTGVLGEINANTAATAESAAALVEETKKGADIP